MIQVILLQLNINNIYLNTKITINGEVKKLDKTFKF